MGAIELVADKKTRRRFDDPGRVGLICRDHFFREGFIMRAVFDTMVMCAAADLDRRAVRGSGSVIQKAPRSTLADVEGRNHGMSRPIVVIPCCSEIIGGSFRRRWTEVFRPPSPRSPSASRC